MKVFIYVVPIIYYFTDMVPQGERRIGNLGRNSPFLPLQRPLSLNYTMKSEIWPQNLSLVPLQVLVCRLPWHTSDNEQTFHENSPCPVTRSKN